MLIVKDNSNLKEINGKMKLVIGILVLKNRSASLSIYNEIKCFFMMFSTFIYYFLCIKLFNFKIFKGFIYESEVFCFYKDFNNPFLLNHS